MKTYCTLLVAAYLLRLTALATESNGHYTSKVNKMDGDEAATIKQRVNETRLAAGNENRPKAAQAAAAANQALASCSGVDSFTLSGYHDGAFDGCYSDVLVSGVTYFSLNGDFEDDHYYFPLVSEYGYYYWGFGTAVYDEDTMVLSHANDFCWDTEFLEWSTTHPTEVTSWDCTSSAGYDAEFSLACGCNSAPSTSVPGAAVATAFLALLGANLLLVW